jgi:aspartyl-tRNA(Asn)/glutamyl-tRNA(Gln) amidotransferase subunit C
MVKKDKTDKDSIKHLAQLAKLSLSQKELEKYSKEISSILDYVDQVQEVDLEGEFRSQTDLRSVMRKDEFSDSLSQKEAISGRSHKSEEGFFTITSVIHK